jgi:spore photoproduct lyase
VIDTLYVEEALLDHPRVHAIRSRHAGARVVSCRRYHEVFNRRAQDFRLQKRRPALLLAAKHGRLVMPAPPGYGIGAARNYYFSHMLNCLYDCRYCFLQGMYRSANYVLFVNYEAFADAIRVEIDAAPGVACFFSGYDCDSLALERLTGFVDFILPLFEAEPAAWLELRTKSVRIGALLGRRALRNCVVAYSLAPAAVAAAFEHRAPATAARLEALGRLGERGWPLGLRFDPLIRIEGFRQHYRDLFREVARRLDPAWIHSITLGAFRMPAGYFARLAQLYPDDRLLAGAFERRTGMTGYRAPVAQEMIAFCHEQLAQLLPGRPVFRCDLA